MRSPTLIAGLILRGGTIALLLAVASCGNLYFGDDPGHEFPKATGPLTTPPKSLANGANAP